MSKGRVPKIFWAAVLVILALGAGRASLALALADIQPDVALSIQSDQSQALVASAANGISTGDGLDLAQRQASAALIANPMEAQAAAHLGTIRHLRNDLPAARASFAYSLRLSRRVTLTHLWWIERWAEQGDLARAIYHYNSALRTSRSAPSLLFPTLVAAGSNDQIAAAIAEMFAETHPWNELFQRQLAQSGSAASVATTFEAIAGAGRPIDASAFDTALRRLVDLGSASQAIALYASATGNGGIGQIRELPSSIAEQGGTMFDWTLDSQGPGYWDGGSMAIDATSQTRQLVAHQTVMLGRGEVKIAFAHDEADDVDDSLDVAIVCLGVPAEIVQSTAARGSALILTASLSGKCPVQRLEIYSAGGRGPGIGALRITSTKRLADPE